MDEPTEPVTDTCIICFDEIEGKCYTCGESKCYSPLCGECISLCIKDKESRGVLPECVNPRCNSYYLRSHITDLGGETTRLYDSCFLKYMVVQNGTKYQKEVEEGKMIERIRSQKLKFLKATFPKAITLVAEYGFQKKLRKIDRQRLRMIKEKLKMAKRLCMNAYCDGFLSDEYVCMTCSTAFCKDCEKPLNEGHECKAEDIQSVNLIKACVKCPNCNIAVLKKDGCNNMTCSNCNVNFSYTTGEKTRAGAHGANASIKVNLKSKKISTLYRSELESKPEILTLIKEIEKFKPRKKSGKYWVGPLKKYYKHKDDVKGGRELARSFETHYSFIQKNRRYMYIMNEIENLIRTDTITSDILNDIIHKCKQILKTRRRKANAQSKIKVV